MNQRDPGRGLPEGLRFIESKVREIVAVADETESRPPNFPFPNHLPLGYLRASWLARDWLLLAEALRQPATALEGL
jgi:hypothetical protein